MIGRSTGGLIAVELARRFPDKVKALVLLEPALFTSDPDAQVRARNLRLRVLERSAGRPGLLAAAVMREALGDAAWESFPEDLQQMLAGTGHAVLAGIRRPTLLVSAEDAPEACRLVNARLAGALPMTRTVMVADGHLINPAHPAVLDFVDRIAARADTWT